MKHEVTTLNTKLMLAASLKKFMNKKPLSKITISEIIADCGVNRKTFYYHFEDIFALLKWVLEREVIGVVKQFDLLVDYEAAIVFVMDYVENNHHILNCAYDSIGRDQLKRFFYSDFIGIMEALVDEVECDLGIRTNTAYKRFVCEFYTEALSGLLIEWLMDPKARLHEDRAANIENIKLVFMSSLPAILQAKIDKPAEHNATTDTM